MLCTMTMFYMQPVFQSESQYSLYEPLPLDNLSLFRTPVLAFVGYRILSNGRNVMAFLRLLHKSSSIAMSHCSRTFELALWVNHFEQTEF